MKTISSIIAIASILMLTSCASCTYTAQEPSPIPSASMPEPRPWQFHRNECEMYRSDDGKCYLEFTTRDRNGIIIGVDSYEVSSTLYNKVLNADVEETFTVICSSGYTSLKSIH